MAGHNRRTFLKLSGSVLGGVFAGSTVVAAERTDRFVVSTSNTSTGALERAGLDVVHDIGEANLAVVAGTESSVDSTGATYVPDLTYSLAKPEDGDLDTRMEDDDTKGKGKQSESATDESFYSLQWDKQSQRVPDAHEVTRGEGSRVAIIDSGVAAGHPDLQHAVNTDLSRDFTGDGYGAGGPYGGDHGTHVAGIVAASDTNGTGVVGTAPGTDLVDCRVFSQTGGASFGDILAAVTYSAAIGADAANLSLGAYPIPREGLGGFYGKSLNRVMTYANSQGTLLVIAAGNDAADLQHDGNFISLPNEGAQACSVSATGPVGFGFDASDYGGEEPPEAPAVYTNYGTNAVTVGAPGGNYSYAAYLEAYDGDDVSPLWYYDLVLNTIATPEFGKNGKLKDVTYGYGWKAGTSMAAPQVAGAAALVKSVNPDYSANQVESVLKETASVPDGYEKKYYGAGQLDTLGAVLD